jgi:hypothetical protein
MQDIRPPVEAPLDIGDIEAYSPENLKAFEDPPPFTSVGGGAIRVIQIPDELNLFFSKYREGK